MYEGRTAGRWLDINPLIMHSRLSLAVAAIALSLPTQALAADERAFDVPKGSLSSALPLISRQAGVSISVARSAEHTSEIQSLMRISYAVFSLKQKNKSIKQ